MKFIIFLITLIIFSTTINSIKWSDEKIHDFDNFNSIDHKQVFEEWCKAFNKSYTSIEEKGHKFITWIDNWYKILRHNHFSNSTYTLRLNKFGDMNEEEFRLFVHGPKGSCLKQKSLVDHSSFSDESASFNPNKKFSTNPSLIDWRTKGVVTPVKDQGSCGSCWAFSTTGAMECRVAIATGVLNSLSEQQLIDCSSSYGNEGCNGGFMDYGFKYAIDNGGLCTESEYPYTATNGTCISSTCGKFYDPISNYSDVKKDNENDLETMVSKGCVSVAIEANQFSFQYYSGGVINSGCGINIDHGVLIVGYNNENIDNSYWIVKNSWGTDWGVNGYVYICKDCNKNAKRGECGINKAPSYPIV